MIKLFYSTREVEEAAWISGMISQLESMGDVLNASESLASLDLTLNDGHVWRVEQIHGLLNVSYICPDGAGPHSVLCIPPPLMTQEEEKFLNTFFKDCE